ncbi:MAG: META domain-containing protein [Candidatus Promineifilaceae bacterium]
MNRIRNLIVLLALAVLVAACGGQEPTPTAVPTAAPPEVPTEAPAPTEVPTEAPPPTEAPTEAPPPTEETMVEPAGAETGIIGTTWQWEQFQDTSGENNVFVPEPSSYTLTLQPDGTAAIRADCNQVLLGYTLDGNSLTFAPSGPSTLAFCGEQSLDSVYLQRLSEVVSYVLEDGKLYLNLMADAGNMIFGRSGLAITPEQISLDTQGLPYSWQAVVVPETPYDESMPPGPMGLPEHMEILFGVTDPADRQPSDPVMYIIPVNAYRAMWDRADNPSVSEAIAAIERLSFALPSPAPTSGLPALPYEGIGGGVNDLAVQVGRAVPQNEVNETSATQTGYRFVGRWAQDANPVTNQGLRYVYEGFTNDGQYLVSFFYPVSTDALPADVSSVPAEEMDQFNSDPQAAINAKAEQLNALTPSDWDPDLTTLDALVASLEITDMPIAGIQDETWVWTDLQPSATSEEVVPVADPSLYQVIYHSDGTINVIADCNLASLPYELTASGMAGGMLAQPGPMTLAECGPDSRYNEFVNNIMAAQDYRVRAGGQSAELVLPAGGGTMIMASLDAFSRGIYPPQPEPGEPTATVIAPDGVNVRTGPGSEYGVLGVARFGQSGRVVGVSEDGEWWVVYIPGAPNDQGWVSGQFVSVENADNVPVISAPPIELPPPTPTPAPTAPAPSEITFEASRTTINAGETATLSWDVENVRAVFMYPVGGNYANYPVAGQASREVMPGITTTYELLVFNTDDTTSSERIEITVVNGLTANQWTLQSMSSPSIGLVTPLPGTQLTARFEASGNLSGSAGCNNYSGGFRAYDQVLRIGGPLGTGRTLCDAPTGIMDQEQVFLNLMQSASTFRISAGQLSIFDSAGNRVLVFNAG